jgi:2-iminoacetate synthase
MNSNVLHPVDPMVIESQLASPPVFDRGRFREILQKAGEMKGISFGDASYLLFLSDPQAVAELTDLAIRVKEAIYGRRIVLFAPLYTSSYCSNDCLYCGFRAANPSPRRSLSLAEIARESETIVRMGHKRVLMVAGEQAGLSPEVLRDQVLAIYSVNLPQGGNIRRVNVNVAPQTQEGFGIIKSAGLGTYQCFQETYHEPTYRRMHGRGPKSDFLGRLQVFNRCIPAGIDDFGMGILFGLYDYRFEILALLQHVASLEREFGIGPHTLSIPRLEPAEGTDIFETTPWRVSDDDLVKLTAILRLTVPYTGIILSTRESPEMRRRLLRVGVSQMSAGSVTNPGGYAEGNPATAQFDIQDHRSLDEVIGEACRNNFIPSFCTGCYRRGRTGEAFQHLAKDHHISPYCSINAVVTLQEFLEDYASPQTRLAGEACIHDFLQSLSVEDQRRYAQQISRVKSGERDLIA